MCMIPVLRINHKHTVVKNKTIMEKDTTKNANSRAVMALIDDVKNVLLELKEKEQENKDFLVLIILKMIIYSNMRTENLTALIQSPEVFREH